MVSENWRHLIYSDDLETWDGGQALLKPKFPRESVQIGNCGSPIALDEGWLLLTHGASPVRKYSIGAALLDKRDPSKVLARSAEPLVRPDPSEREGYFPNLVYTCGAMRHNDQIVLLYAVSDTFSNFATVKIAAPLQTMENAKTSEAVAPRVLLISGRPEIDDDACGDIAVLQPVEDLVDCR
jgi:predicted GH43/DUF377 family glycosyl hydrolase